MARRQRSHRGGIASLRDLIANHKTALEYDLIRLGLRLDWLGSDLLSWRDLLVIVKHAPRDSALAFATQGRDVLWGLPEQLAAASFDALNILSWMQSEDGSKGRNRPKPLQRPGVAPESDHYGKSSVEIDEMEAWLKARNPNQHT